MCPSGVIAQVAMTHGSGLIFDTRKLVTYIHLVSALSRHRWQNTHYILWFKWDEASNSDMHRIVFLFKFFLIILTETMNTGLFGKKTETSDQPHEKNKIGIKLGLSDIWRLQRLYLELEAKLAAQAFFFQGFLSIFKCSRYLQQDLTT